MDTDNKGTKQRSPVLEMVFSIIRIGVAVYIGLCLVVFFRQSGYVYYPDRLVGLTPAYFNLAFEEVSFRTQDGETIAAWFIPVSGGAGDNPGRTVLFCHGNGGDIGDRLDSIKTFHDLGLNMLIFDYRGYGDSTGKPTEKGTYLDALAAWQYLTDVKSILPADIMIFGESLGGVVAAWLAGEIPPAPPPRADLPSAESPVGGQGKPGALVIESTFTSAPDMASKMFPYLPIRFLCRFKYDTLSLAGKIGCPVLIAHSRDDEMIPYEHGKRLFEAAPEPKRFVEMRGSHNSGGLNADRDYQKILAEFLDKYLGKPPVEMGKQ